MGLKLANNAVSLLGANLSSMATSLVLLGTPTFPSLPDPTWHMYLTLISLSGGTDQFLNPNVFEIVKVVGPYVQGTTTMNIVRGQDGTTANAFTVGDLVDMRVCRAVLNEANGPGGGDTELQFNSGGLFAGISPLTYDATRADVPNGSAPLLYTPLLRHTNFVGMMNHPTYDFSATLTSDFITPFNVVIGNSTTPIPAGSKGNFGGYEFNYETNTVLANTNGIDGAHALGATMTNHGGSPMQGTAIVHICDTIAGTTYGHVYNYMGNIAGGTHFGYVAEAYGTQPGTTAFKVLSKTDDPTVQGWSFALDCGGNNITGTTNIGFATTAGVNTDYQLGGSGTDTFRIYGGGTNGSGILYSRPHNTHVAGTWAFRDNPDTADVNKVLINGSSGEVTMVAATITGIENNVSAAVGGGQAGATGLSGASRVHNVTTVANANDSVKLPAATGSGAVHWVKNAAAANSMQLFGTNPDTIDGVATATGVAVAAGKSRVLIDLAAGEWMSLAGA